MRQPKGSENGTWIKKIKQNTTTAIKRTIIVYLLGTKKPQCNRKKRMAGRSLNLRPSCVQNKFQDKEKCRTGKPCLEPHSPHQVIYNDIKWSLLCFYTVVYIITVTSTAFNKLLTSTFMLISQPNC